MLNVTWDEKMMIDAHITREQEYSDEMPVKFTCDECDNGIHEDEHYYFVHSEYYCEDCMSNMKKIA